MSMGVWMSPVGCRYLLRVRLSVEVSWRCAQGGVDKRVAWTEVFGQGVWTRGVWTEGCMDGGV